MEDKKGSDDKLGSSHVLPGKNTRKENTRFEISFGDRLSIEFVEFIHP